MKNEIVYGSDPMPHEHLLKNLAIYYDKVYLPHPYGLDGNSRVLWSNLGMNFDDDLYYGFEQFNKWKSRNSYLFDESIVETLPDIFDDENIVGDEIGTDLIRRFGIEHLDNYMFTKNELLSKSVKMGKSFILYGELALALHYGYSKKEFLILFGRLI